ncbi:M14 family zinc carboxypeptidase [Peribacillus sp. NJ4]|uniref:M14 family zinc carboxypeptidase n=1 Tax=Peribacillus TaxID=2675229 RepID=UPI0025A0B6FF|nr:M14 family zinc carboxypeptidase [Peribacillus sp. NJ4]MDM5211985.1 M14 family zinc carboxypeptidase [Peribacillus sp. NJ4]
MKNRKIVSTLGVFVLSASIAAPTLAAKETSPGTPSQQTYSVSGFTDHAELGKKLEQIASDSQGKVKVDVAGYSNRNREIYKASVGTGEKVVLIQSEIHGNEKTGTEAILNILKFLGTNSPEAEKIRKEITLVALPKINPDAAELNRRGNDMTWAEVVEQFPQLAGAKPSWNYYTYKDESFDYESKPGFDVNRDFNPDLNYNPQAKDFPGKSSTPGWFITPESQASRDVYKSLIKQYGKVEIFVDLHHQAPYYEIDGTDDLVTYSISGQFVPDPRTPSGQAYAKYAKNYNYDFSRQLNVAVYNAMKQQGNSPFGNISLYPQNQNLPGTALGAFALNGSGTVLFEVRGQTQSFGQKKKGMLTKAVESGLYGIIDGVTDGSVYKINPEQYESIPLTEGRQ